MSLKVITFIIFIIGYDFKKLIYLVILKYMECVIVYH